MPKHFSAVAFAVLMLNACGVETEPNPNPEAGSGGNGGSGATDGGDDAGGSGGNGGSGGSTGGTGGVVGGSGGTGGTGGSASDCDDDSDCGPDLPQCNAAGRCVSCTANAACEDRNDLLHCETTLSSDNRGQCVACLEDDHCEDSDDGEYCNNNQCVPCKTNADCTDLTKPQCGDDGQCTGCTDNEACEGRDGTEACVTAAGPKRGHCVACVGNNDCPDADAPQCTDDNTCGACTADDACTGRDGSERCNLREDAETFGECVQCTGETEGEECGDNSCKQSTGECTNTPRGESSPCEACEADSECSTGTKCVLQTLGDTTVGHFCFYDRATQGGQCADTISGLKPYSQTLTNARSIDSTEASQQATYCLPRTSCKAFADATNYDMTAAPKPCALNSDCGVGNNETDGAYCIPGDFTVEGARLKCSYLCDSNNDCPGNGFSTCATGPGVHFCRPN